MSPFTPFLDHHGCVILDGGLSTALEARGYSLDDRLWSAALLRDAPEAITAVHRAYLLAGADVITTSSYQASIPGFVDWGLSKGEAARLLVRSAELALEARDQYVRDRVRDGPRDEVPGSTRDEVLGSAPDAARDDAPDAVRDDAPDAVRGPAGGREGEAKTRPPPLVAASVGPYGAYLADGSEYDGRYEGVSRSDLVDFHAHRLELLADSGVDLLACETVPSGREAEVLVDLISHLEAPPQAWMAFSCADGARLHDGTPVEEAAALASGVDRFVAVGVNCTAPRYLPELVRRIRAVHRGHIIVYPNSGELYDAESGRWSKRSDAEARHDRWLHGVLEARREGADALGGCCRVGPEDIGELRRRLLA